MKATLKVSLFTAVLGLSLASCSKEEAATPTAPAAVSATADANGEAVLRAGERLTAGQYLQSSDGQYRMYMQGDGNLVTYRLSDNSVRFNTQTQGNPGAFCVMQTDGNLVVYAANGRPLFNTGARTSPDGRHYATLNGGTLFLILANYGIVAVEQGRITVLNTGR